MRARIILTLRSARRKWSCNGRRKVQGEKTAHGQSRRRRRIRIGKTGGEKNPRAPPSRKPQRKKPPRPRNPRRPKKPNRRRKKTARQSGKSSVKKAGEKPAAESAEKEAQVESLAAESPAVAEKTADDESAKKITAAEKADEKKEKAEKFRQRAIAEQKYGTGRRKTAVARVFLRLGYGNITVNGRTVERYFTRDTSRRLAFQPLAVIDREKEFDFLITVRGGGESGQAGAVRHGVARALIKFDESLRPILRAAGLVRRDPRAVERKKVGLHKARRAKQFSKR